MGKKDKFASGSYSIQNQEKTENIHLETQVSGFVAGNTPDIEDHISQVRDKVEAVKKRYPNAKVKWHEFRPNALKNKRKKQFNAQKSKKALL